MPVVDFAGAATTHAVLAARYRAALAPTVLVVGSRGEPLGSPLVGLLTVDFYASYLEAAIDAGLRGCAADRAALEPSGHREPGPRGRQHLVLEALGQERDQRSARRQHVAGARRRRAMQRAAILRRQSALR